ncbi:MAG: hypothetical protein KC731_18495 [Myxococcales bacterium]|nr:hypothetical protein [Myxococcales bacterium]
MPELAEVELGRTLLERVVVGRRITEVWCDDDDIVFDGVTPEAVRDALTGKRAIAAHRHGKHLWLELEAGPHPLFHFGMTGAFRLRGEAPLELESRIGIGDTTWPPRFAKIHLWLEDGGEIVMTNARRLGRIRLRASPPDEPPLADLGFDPLLALPSRAEFVRRAKRRKIPIKALLLDQGFAAGVGNWLADEILYQSKIDPRRIAASLDEDELARLRSVMRRVVKRAVAVGADKDRFPRSWLFHHRWGKQAGARTARGEPIEHLELGGRTTAWVPSVQR